MDYGIYSDSNICVAQFILYYDAKEFLRAVKDRGNYTLKALNPVANIRMIQIEKHV